MKLQNKKTGEVKEVIVGGYPVSGKTKMWECSEMDANEETGYKSLGTYTSLAELNAEWEDYKEPKGYWFIRDGGNIDHNLYGKSIINRHKEIGNYFATKEEAEKAVEKLKAWERLKEAGFEFSGWTHTPITKSLTGYNLHIKAYSNKLAHYMDDLELIFGGKE